jgi:hypothetical protein
LHFPVSFALHLIVKHLKPRLGSNLYEIAYLTLSTVPEQLLEYGLTLKALSENFS